MALFSLDSRDKFSIERCGVGIRKALQIIFEGNGKLRYAKTESQIWDNSDLNKLASENDIFCPTQCLHSENKLLQMRLSLEFKEKIDDYLKLIGLNPFQHFFCFNESNIIKLGIACSKSSQCNIHWDHRFPSHTYKAWMKSYICQIKHRKSLRYPHQMLAQGLFVHK